MYRPVRAVAALILLFLAGCQLVGPATTTPAPPPTDAPAQPSSTDTPTVLHTPELNATRFAAETQTASAQPSSTNTPTITPTAISSEEYDATVFAGQQRTAQALTPPPTGQGPACVVAATRTPPPGAPTRSPAPLGTAVGVVDPHVEICASAPTIRVGETVTVIGLVVDIGLAYYQLYLQDSGAPEAAQALEITYDGQVRSTAEASAVLDVVSTQAEMWQATFVLRGRAPGVVQVRIGATGEVHYGYPGPATWSGSSSDPITITVTE